VVYCEVRGCWLTWYKHGHDLNAAAGQATACTASAGSIPRFTIVLR